MRRIKESPGDTQEKVAMCFIDEAGKTLGDMRSEEQVTRAVENCVKIVIAKIEIDESTTVDNEMQF